MQWSKNVKKKRKKSLKQKDKKHIKSEEKPPTKVSKKYIDENDNESIGKSLLLPAKIVSMSTCPPHLGLSTSTLIANISMKEALDSASPPFDDDSIGKCKVDSVPSLTGN